MPAKRTPAPRRVVRNPVDEEYAERHFMFRAAALLGVFLIVTLVVTVGVTVYMTFIKPGSYAKFR